MFLDTKPAQLERTAGKSGDSEFNVEKASEIIALLQRLIDVRALINLSSADGSVLTTMLWWIDPASQTIAFSVDDNQPGLQEVVGAGESVAITYLETEKLQFPLVGMQLERDPQGLALQCRLPDFVTRLQRRRFFRARVPQFSTISLRFRMPDDPEQVIVGRVVDLSIDGCGLLLPDDSPVFAAGSVIPSCRVDIDPEERFISGLEIQRSAIHRDKDGKPLGTLLGCRWTRLDGSAERMLQVYINRQQKLQRLMSAARR